MGNNDAQAAGSTQNAKAMASVLSMALKNGALSYYGSQQANITPLPSSATAFVSQTTMTRAERLDKISNVPTDDPTDDRAQEVTSALATISVVGGCLILQGVGNGLGLEELTPYTSLVLYGIAGLGIVDNFYDAIQTFTGFVVKMNSDRLPDA
eukprot:scaffold7082_cov267-Chaetoceros_neogracile.AAC.1